MDKKSGASKRDPEKVKQRKLKRGKRREDRRKYGFNKKRRAENKAEAAAKRKALAQAAIVGGDARGGLDDGPVGTGSIQDGTFDYTGSSMKIKSNKNISMAVPAKKIKKIEDGSSMYGKKHGGSMSHGKKDGMSMYGKKHGASMYGKKHGASMYGKEDGMSMYGKKHGASMSGEKYDAKQAYNKGLTASARLHYLENERHDKTHAHPILKHMKKF